MKVYSSKGNTNSSFQFVFIHGWGGNEKSLLPLKRLFENKYDCFLLCLSGFSNSLLEKSYKISDYLEEVNDFIKNNLDKKVVIIGHSFGGKIALMLKRIHQEYIVIALAPSIVKNPFSLKIFLKIKLFKLFKKLHLPILKCLKGSKDYQNSDGLLRQTFLNTHHAYLNKNEIKDLNKCLIIGFNNDQEVKIKSLKKLPKINKKITLLIFSGNHFSYRETLLDIYHSISVFILEN